MRGMDIAHPLLAPEHVAFIARGVSVIVGTCDQHLRPSVMRAVGSQVRPDGGEVTVYLGRSQAGQLLEDLAANGRIAVVFSQPSTHRTLQLKATRVRTRPLDEADRPLLQRYLESMEHELALIGHPPPFARHRDKNSRRVIHTHTPGRLLSMIAARSLSRCARFTMWAMTPR